MPIAGAVGAISAANRASRNRSSQVNNRRVPLRPTTSCRYTSAAAAPKPQAKTIDVSETTSVDSKPSILSMFKSQVQETGGFFKKQKDALAEKMQKMTSTKKDVAAEATMQKNDNPAVGATPVVQPPAATLPAAQRKAVVNPAWISSLEQMGFESSKVQEAIEMVGGQPEQMDDVLQVLVAMHSSTEPAPAAPTAPVEPAAPAQPTAPAPTPAAKAPKPLEEVITEKATTPPPLPPMSSVGSADFEMADQRFLGRSAVGSAEFELASDRHTFAVPAVSSGIQKPKILDPSTVLSLQQMGFQPDSIHAASLRCGPNASFDKLCDVLLTMGAPLSPINSGGAASSADSAPFASAAAQASPPKRTLEEEADMCSPNTAVALVAEIVNEVAMASLEEALTVDAPCQEADEEEDTPELVLEVEPDSPLWNQETFISEAAEKEAAIIAEKAISEAMLEVVGDEVSKQDLVKAVVASVIAGASKKELSRQEAATMPKQMADETTPWTASPVKGGA